MQMTLCSATCVGKAANCIYPNKVVVDNAADMESAVAVDHVCATYTGNRRGNSNFIESDVIPMDIDNDHSDNPTDWIMEMWTMCWCQADIICLQRMVSQSVQDIMHIFLLRIARMQHSTQQ